MLDGPGTDHITSRALASQRFEVTITGPGGHSWRDSLYGNPVHALSRAVASFTAQAGSLAQPGPPDAPGPRSSFNFGIFEGGSSINSIPTEARAKIDLRSESLERIEKMAALLAQAVDQAVDAENARGSGPQGERTNQGHRLAPQRGTGRGFRLCSKRCALPILI